MTLTTVYQVYGFSVSTLNICKHVLNCPDDLFSVYVLNILKNENNKDIDFNKYIEMLESNNLDNIYADFDAEFAQDIRTFAYPDSELIKIYEISHDARDEYDIQENFIIGINVASFESDVAIKTPINPCNSLTTLINDKMLLKRYGTVVQQLQNHKLYTTSVLKIYSIQEDCTCCS